METFIVKQLNQTSSKKVKIQANSSKDAFKQYVDKFPNSYGEIEVFKPAGFFKAETTEIFINNLDQIEEEKLYKKKVLTLANKLKDSGFNSLDNKDTKFLIETLDVFFASDSESTEELYLAKITLSDTQAYRFLSLRSNSRTALHQQVLLETMNSNLSKISKKTGDIRASSVFTGFAAARHLGEKIGEDYSGEE